MGLRHNENRFSFPLKCCKDQHYRVYSGYLIFLLDHFSGKGNKKYVGSFIWVSNQTQRHDKLVGFNSRVWCQQQLQITAFLRSKSWWVKLVSFGFYQKLIFIVSNDCFGRVVWSIYCGADHRTLVRNREILFNSNMWDNDFICIFMVEEGGICQHAATGKESSFMVHIKYAPYLIVVALNASSLCLVTLSWLLQ